MAQRELTETLQVLVHRHGMSSVLHSLADIQAAPTQRSSSVSRKPTNKDRRKLSAADYVDRMVHLNENAEAMRCAAQRFEDGRFLHCISDIREFCRNNEIELAKSVSRASSIPRIFTYLATLGSGEITKMLESGIYSGPARLAPLADAIRNHSGGIDRNRLTRTAEPCSVKIGGKQPKP